jgi:hypothetical protein
MSNDADLPTGENWAGQKFTITPPIKKSVQRLVIEDIAERERFGTEKYGQASYTDTPDDPVEGGPVGQAYKEALDMVIYLRWQLARMEQTKIITLCGSTKFIDLFHRVNLEQTVRGNIVLSIGCDRRSDDDLATLTDLGFSMAEVKPALDRLHRRKIDISQGIIVISDDSGYIGESTRDEIDYAIAHNKAVEWLHPAAEERYYAQ